MSIRVRMAGIAALSGLVLSVSAASGAEVASDTFSYPDGVLTGQNGGAGTWTSIWFNNGLNASGGEAVTNSLPGDSKAISRAFTDPATTHELFVKFTLTTPPAFAVSDTFTVELTIGANTTVLTVGKGVNHNNFIVTGVLDSGIAVTPGQTYTIVAAITYAHGAVTQKQLLWVNPDASDFYDPVTGNSSADAVGHLGAIPRAGAITLNGSLGGVKFDNLLLCDALATAVPPACPGDVNGDGFTNTGDFNILAGNFGAGPGATRAQGDLSGDGFVNTADFNILAGDFGCP